MYTASSLINCCVVREKKKNESSTTWPTLPSNENCMHFCISNKKKWENKQCKWPNVTCTICLFSNQHRDAIDNSQIFSIVLIAFCRQPNRNGGKSCRNKHHFCYSGATHIRCAFRRWFLCISANFNAHTNADQNKNKKTGSRVRC